MAKILKGAPVAEAISVGLTDTVISLKRKDIFPKLAMIRVGERPDDIAYEHSILNRCKIVGIDTRRIIVPEDVSPEEILSIVWEINEDDATHGLLIFRPLKDKKLEEKVSRLITPKKDIDSMTLQSLAKVFVGKGYGFPPCTAEAVIRLLNFYEYDLSGKNVVVVGRSLVIGKPVSILLQNENATVTMCHTKTVDLPHICKNADVIVASAGVANMIDESYVSPGQIIVDVGINIDYNGNLCGDVDFEKVEPIVSAITPVPAGVGSITTAILASHVIEAASYIE